MEAKLGRWPAAVVAAACLSTMSIANAAIPASERQALIDLYNTAQGDSWVVSTGWNGAAGTECTWYGITCDAAGEHVTGISLWDNKLAGALPPLDALTELTVLDVHSDDCATFKLFCVPSPNANHLFAATLQPLTSLRHLQRLYGHAAGFSGAIPPLSSFAVLITLDVGNNALTGTVPALEGLDTLEDFLVGGNTALTGTLSPIALPNLRWFDVSATRVTGTIPALNHLANLVSFNASITTLSGSIPSLAGLSHLETFDAAASFLDGTIGSLDGLSSLTRFDVDFNRLTGPIPSLSDLTALRTFDVHHNQLSGPIPSLSALTQMNEFIAWGNQLSGSIPSLEGLEGLQWFDVSLNQLSGEIPSLTGRAALNRFDVSWNALTGPIPPLSNQGLDAISDLIFWHNQLTGSIPSLAGLSMLNYFNARENRLTGPLPALDASLTMLSTFFADHNALSGTIPDLPVLFAYNVSSNALTGPIPASVTNVQHFDASDNALSGEIPDISQAEVLGSFDVGFNNLTGTLPSPGPRMSQDGHSATLCPNHLAHTPSAAWDAIAGHSPWYDGCTASYVDPNQFGLTGAWYDTADPGKGFLIDAMPDHVSPGVGTYFGGWFNFLCGPSSCPGGTPDVPEAQQQWFTFQDNVDSAHPYVRQTIYESRGGSFDALPAVGADPIGLLAIAFDDCSHALLRYHIPRGPYPDRTVRLTRLTPSIACSSITEPGAVPQTNTLLSGAWYDPTTAGQGLVFDINAENGVLFAAWYTFAVDGADQDPLNAQRWYTLQAEITGSGRAFQGVTIYSSTGGLFDDTYSFPEEGAVTTTPVGSADVSFQSCSALTIDYRFTSGEIAGRTGTLHLARLSPVPAGCAD